MIDYKYTSLCFEFDLRTMAGNPFHADTPFGRPVIVSVVNVFEERDRLQERVEELEASLARILNAQGQAA